MTFLPIVERELRVASRKRSTMWVRGAAAFVALVIGSGFLVMSTVGFVFVGFVSTASLGKALFGTLTWLSLAVALSAGLFFTSDCLSEEKREGTMGFLFLTDLSGYDVVLGKLLATSLRGFYALLAVFPVLAVTLLLGGVTGAQFWNTALALVNALFLSLAAGLFASAISRDSQKAFAGTLVLLVLLVAGGPASDAILAKVLPRAFNPVLSLSSPGFLFVAAGAWGKSPFWLGFLVNQTVAWLLLGVTSFLVPRTWQEKAAPITNSRRSWARWWRFGGAKRRAALRQKLLGVNPVLWLACRDRWQAVALWTVSLLMTAGAVAMFPGQDKAMWWTLWSGFGGALTLLWYLGVASQASRFFVEAKSSGLIELLLATPLTGQQIVQGQWRALLRMFGPSLALCLAAQLVGALLVQRATWSRLGAVASAPTTATTITNGTVTTTATGTVTVSGGGFAASGVGFVAPSGFVILATSLAATLTTVANLGALGWFGMWMGLNSKGTNLATLKTIVFVQIIPWFFITFTAGMIFPLLLLPTLMKGSSNAAPQMMIWYPLITSGVSTLLDLAKDVAFVLWTRRKLYSQFRERSLRILMPIRSALPPPLPRGSLPGIAAV